MNEGLYRVVIGEDVYAQKMRLSTALALVETLFDKWYNEQHLAITIEREEPEIDMAIELEELVEASK